jgi:uncharacterized protein YejL (UPF0352 family)
MKVKYVYKQKSLEAILKDIISYLDVKEEKVDLNLGALYLLNIGIPT